MEKIRVLELFGGIRAPHKALLNLGFEVETVDYVENDPKVVRIANAIYGTNYEPKSVIDYHYEGEPFDILIGGSPCFTGEMKVLTNQGYKELINVAVGDKVLTHQHQWQEVHNVFVQGQKEIWEIQLSKNNKIRTTSNHQFWIYDLKTQSFQWMELKNINREKHLFTQPIIQDEIPFHHLDPNFWYICGRYLADGWTRRRKERNNKLSTVIICANPQKVNYLKQRMDPLFHFTEVKERTVHKLQISNVEFTEFIDENFGHLAKDKFISQAVMNLPKDCLKELVQGYFDGDGSLASNKVNRYSSINENLLLSIQMILLKLGRSSNLHKSFREKTTVIEGRVVNQQNTFELKENSKGIFVNGYYCFKPMKILNTQSFENVYDLEIEHDNSFTVQNTLVHNCQDISATGKQAGALENTRSSLIWEQLRVVMEVRPRFYLWENVKNLLSNRHSFVFEEHNNFLESIGYRVEYKVLNAKDFGIPQSRERVFILAIRNDVESDFNFWNLKTTVMKPLKYFLQTPRDRDYVNENKQKYMTEKIKNNKVQLIDKEDINSKIGTLTTQPSRGKLESGAFLEPLDKKYFIPVNSYVENHFKKSTQHGEYWGKTKLLSDNSVANTMTTNQKRNVNSGLVLDNYYVKKPKNYQKEYATEVRGIKPYQKTPFKHFEVFIDRKHSLQFPNFKVDWDFGAYSRVYYNDIVGTLTTTNNVKILEPIETKTGHLIFPMSKYNNANNVHPLDEGIPIKTITTNTRRNGTTERILTNLVDDDLLVVKYQDKLWNVRVLTELECYRLMGFSDEDFEKAKKVETSRMLYHTAGNSIVVPVLEAIFSELFKV